MDCGVLPEAMPKRPRRLMKDAGDGGVPPAPMACRCEPTAVPPRMLLSGVDFLERVVQLAMRVSPHLLPLPDRRCLGRSSGTTSCWRRGSPPMPSMPAAASAAQPSIATRGAGSRASATTDASTSVYTWSSPMSVPPCAEPSVSDSLLSSPSTSPSPEHTLASLPPCDSPLLPTLSGRSMPRRLGPGALPAPASSPAPPALEAAALGISSVTGRSEKIAARSGWSVTVGLGEAARMAASPRRPSACTAIMGLESPPTEPRLCGTEAARVSIVCCAIVCCASFCASTLKASTCPESSRASAAANSARTIGEASSVIEINSKPINRSVASRSGGGAIAAPPTPVAPGGAVCLAACAPPATASLAAPPSPPLASSDP
mmetsp:Transcript_14174/g.44320  ORF Transcript_14174/g.44320 Transcript_14174/m.44320 type:complete len:374 (-) Transcript_14174:2075-3196(-)